MNDPIYFIVKAVPALCLNPNRSRKAHWGELAEAVRALRWSTNCDIRDWGRPRTMLGPVDVWMCICWPSAKRKLLDEVNLAHMTKPVFDGMQDAGIVENDSQFHLVDISQFVMTKVERAHYPNGCIVIAVRPGKERVAVAPIDKHGHVTQAWLDGIPRS